MREIGSLSREEDARVLADHLLTLDISTKLAPRADGSWAIWVHREDQVERARAVLDEFAVDPSDPKFRASAATAREIRKQAEREEKAHRKRVKDLRERWEGPMYLRAPVAFGLIVASVGVTVLMHFAPSLTIPLYFSVFGFTQDGRFINTGFQAIANGEAWRLVTPIFLHFGIFHLFFNMAGMRYLGERIEMRKGSWRFGLICLVAAVAGNVGQAFVSKAGFGGMSGVVFALAGYLWMKGLADPEDGLSLDQRSVNWMLGWLLLGIIAPLTAGPEPPPVFPYNMANMAHGVGLGVGMAFGLLRL